MCVRKQRQQLTWIGKDERPRLEPRILLDGEDKFTKMLILEVKVRNELDDPTATARAAAHTKWCKTATAYASGGTGKPWTYALIPDGMNRVDT